MVDIDHFKSVNDNYGHSVGDEVIANIGALLRNCSRKKDLVGRYGGEEFCVVLLGLGAAETASAAERIRLELMMHSPSWLPDGRQVTASLGGRLSGAAAMHACRPRRTGRQGTLRGQASRSQPGCLLARCWRV